MRRHVGMEGFDPVSVTACPTANAAPTLAFTDPTASITVPNGTATYDLAGTAADAEGAVDFVEVRVDDGAWATATGTATWTHQIPLAVGENWVQVRCADPDGGYSQTHALTITRDAGPDLRFEAWTAPDTVLQGCELEVDFTVLNASATPTTQVRLGYYLSTDATIDTGDFLLATTTIPGLAGGDSVVVGTVVAVPAGAPTGSVHFGAFVDDQDVVAEVNEGNNATGGPLEFVPPLIASVADVGNDQGRQVRINLAASARDVLGSPTPILQYEFFRRIDQLPGPAAVFGGERISAPDKLAGWEYAGAIPAHGEVEYNAVAPTLADSTDQGAHWSVFFVRAATDQPLVFFDSCPDSGYSIDDLPPDVPQGLTVAYAAGGNQLDWDANLETDLRHYRVYRGPDAGFVPGPGNLVETTATTSWLDAVADPWDHHYKISAVDNAGNESPVAAPDEVSGTGTPSATPTRYALHPCAPNPFNPQTTIVYDLPEAARVTLRIYGTDGRLVRTLVSRAMPPGSHEAVWNGRDRSGRPVAAGVYFCRLDAGGYSETRRMVLVN